MTNPHTTLSEAVRALELPEHSARVESQNETGSMATVWMNMTHGLLRDTKIYTEDQVRAVLSAAAELVEQHEAQEPALTVWEGSMPESNGKSNFTAVLTRKGAKGFDIFEDGFTIARSEYPDRVRYEADCVRYLIGELVERPCITKYDADKHSGYVEKPTLAATQAGDAKDAARYRWFKDNYLKYGNSDPDIRRPIILFEGRWYGGHFDNMNDLDVAIDAAMSPTTTRSE